MRVVAPIVIALATALPACRARLFPEEPADRLRVVPLDPTAGAPIHYSLPTSIRRPSSPGSADSSKIWVGLVIEQRLRAVPPAVEGADVPTALHLAAKACAYAPDALRVILRQSGLPEPVTVRSLRALEVADDDPAKKTVCFLHVDLEAAAAGRRYEWTGWAFRQDGEVHVEDEMLFSTRPAQSGR